MVSLRILGQKYGQEKWFWVMAAQIYLDRQAMHDWLFITFSVI